MPVAVAMVGMVDGEADLDRAEAVARCMNCESKVDVRLILEYGNKGDNEPSW